MFYVWPQGLPSRPGSLPLSLRVLKLQADLSDGGVQITERLFMELNIRYDMPRVIGSLPVRITKTNLFVSDCASERSRPSTLMPDCMRKGTDLAPDTWRRSL